MYDLRLDSVDQSEKQPVFLQITSSRYNDGCHGHAQALEADFERVAIRVARSDNRCDANSASFLSGRHHRHYPFCPALSSGSQDVKYFWPHHRSFHEAVVRKD
jgi:hypothetical protein